MRCTAKVVLYCGLGLMTQSAAVAQNKDAHQNSAASPAASTSQSAPAMRYTTGDAEAGAKIYKRYCRGCHGEDGRGGAHTFMPHVDTLTQKSYIDALPDNYLYLAISEGGAAVGKNAYMPPWKETLSQQQIIDVITHVRSLPTY